MMHRFVLRTALTIAAAGSFAAFAKDITSVDVSRDPFGAMQSVTLSFGAGGDSHLYALYDNADKGRAFNGWANAEEVASVAAADTSLTLSARAEWKACSHIRFLLVDDEGRGDIGSAAGVQRIEAVVATGTSTVLDTGLKASSNTSVEIDVTPSGLAGGTHGFFGARSSSWNGNNGGSDTFVLFASTGGWRFDCGARYARTSTNNVVAANGTRYLIKTGTNGALAINGKTVYSAGEYGANAANISGGNNLCIFNYSKGTTLATDGVAGKYYGVKVWGTGSASADTLTLDCVPCVTNGVPCLYDSVSGMYLGGGKFGSTAVKIANGTESSWTGVFLTKVPGKEIAKVSTTRGADGTLASVAFALTKGAASHLYALYGDSDAGEDFDAWIASEEVAAVDGDATEFVLDGSKISSAYGKVRFCLARDDGRIDVGSGAQLVESVVVTNAASGVDTGLKATRNTSVMIDVRPTGLFPNSARGFFGARSGSWTSDYDSFVLFAKSGSATKLWRFDYGVKAARECAESVTIANGTRYVLRTTTGGHLTVDGAEVLGDGGNRWMISGGLNLYLFDYANPAKAGGIANDGVAGTYYAVKAWGTGDDDAKKMTLDLVPCVKDGVACLYNRVDGSYLGEGVFAAPTGKVALNGAATSWSDALATAAAQRAITDTTARRGADGTATSVTVALSGGASGHLYALYGATDGGTDFGAWDGAEEIAAISGTAATNVTVAVKDGWKAGGSFRLLFANDDGRVDVGDAQLVESVVVANGSSGVDTGLKVTGNTSVMVDVMPSGLLDSNMHGFCGARSTAWNNTASGGKDAFVILAQRCEPALRFDYGCSFARKKGDALDNGTRYVLRTSVGGGLSINGETVFEAGESGADAAGISGDNNLYVFDYAKGPAAANDGVPGTYYGVKAWGTGSAGADTLTLDLVPCVKDGAACLYDRVGGSYLGAGKFAAPAGNAVLNGSAVGWTDAIESARAREILLARAVRDAEGAVSSVEFAFSKGEAAMLYAFYDGDAAGWPIMYVPGGMTSCAVTLPPDKAYSSVVFRLAGGESASIDGASFDSPCAFYTGLMASSNTTAELVITPSGLPADGTSYFFGGCVGWSNGGASSNIFAVSSSSLAWGFGYGRNYIQTTSSVADGEKHTILVGRYASGGGEATALKIDDGSFWFNRGADESARVSRCPIVLFGRSNNGAIDGELPAGEFHGFKAWGGGSDPAGTLSMDLVPCVADGTVCLYDKVSGAYFGKGGFAGVASAVSVPAADVLDSTAEFDRMLRPVVAWMRFDEEEPGTAIASGAVSLYEECAGTTKGQAHSYTGVNSGSDALAEYYPRYARPFRGNCVYDPVTGTRRENRAALQFRTAANAEDANKSGAYYGGAAILNVSKGATCHTNAADAITVECFFCTTGGVFDALAPIVGVVTNVTEENTSVWAEEPWAIYLAQNGRLAMRFKGMEYDDLTGRVDDGAWHHVAMTWEGGSAGPSVYLDYGCATNVTPKAGTAAGPFVYDGSSVMRIGGYRGYVAPQGGGEGEAGFRRFPGLIDEVRVSRTALASGQFLRLEPLDPDVVEYVSFDSGPFDAALTTSFPVNDRTYSRAFLSGDSIGGAAFATGVPAAAVAPAMLSTALTNTASLSTAPGSARLRVADVTGVIGEDCADYTVEIFFRTRGQVRGDISQSQTLFRMGEGSLHDLAELSLQADTEGCLRFAFMSNGALAGGGPATVSSGAQTTNLDDGEWHHVAFVNDTRSRSVKVYTDYRITHVATSVSPDWSTGEPLWIGCQPDGSQAFDGWLDECRVTKRALSVGEFLTKDGASAEADEALEPETLLLGRFDGSWTLATPLGGVDGEASARASGTAPGFSGDIMRGKVRLDGTNGVHLADNSKSMQVNTGYVAYPWSPLYEMDEFTVEFFAKATAFAGDWKETRILYMGDVAENPERGFLSVGVRNRDGEFAGRQLSGGNVDALRVSLSIVGANGGAAYGSADMWTGRENFADGKWHHYAIRVTHRTPESASAYVELYVDYEKTWEWDLGGPVNSAALDFVEGGVTKGFHIGPSDLKAAAGMTTVSDNVYEGLVDTFRLSSGALPVEKFMSVLRMPGIMLRFN